MLHIERFQVNILQENCYVVSDDTACYGEVFDESLADEGRSIIASWDSLSLTPEQQEAVDEFQNVTDNPYPWEYIDE